jgi:hypothetical protein
VTPAALACVLLNLIWLAFFIALGKSSKPGKYPYADPLIDSAVGLLWLLLPVTLSFLAVALVLS